MPQYYDVVLADNPAALYRFEEEAGGSSYVDSSSNGRNIVSGINPEDVGFGRGTWSSRSRLSDTGLPIPYTFTAVNELTFEFFFKASNPANYTLIDTLSTTTGAEALLSLSEDPGTPGDYVLKFGLGIGEWDIDIPDTHQYAYVYTDEASELFDSNWHHIVAVWDGAASTNWNANQLQIWIDGVRRDDATTRQTFTGVSTMAPLTFGSAVYITGPTTGSNTELASFDEFAIYEYALSSADINLHYNSAASIEPAIEFDDANLFIPFTDGVLGTAYEYDTPGSLNFPILGLTIQANSSVDVTYLGSDNIAAREILDPSGSLPVSLTGTTLQSGEPNAAGYTGTRWYELNLNPDTVETARIILSSPTSTGKVSIYKQPSLDAYPDWDDLTEEEQELQSPLDSEPSLGQLQLVQTASADQKFTLDQNYGSSYFLQVGLLSGTGGDFTLTWGSADPTEGGSFDNPVEVENLIGSTDYISTENAWLETGEPNSPDITEIRSVWVKWTAPTVVSAATDFRIRGDGTTPFAAEIYTGTAVNALSQVTSGTSYDGTQLFLSLSATPDAVYYLRIATAVDPTSFTVAWGPPIEESLANEPVKNLRVTVHAGVKGGTWGGRAYVANEEITELTNRVGAQFQETLNMPGSGSVTLKIDDPVMRSFGPPSWPDKLNSAWDEVIVNLTSSPAAGSTTIAFTSLPAEVIAGYILLIEDVTVNNRELIQVKSRSGNTITLTVPTKYSHTSGTPLRRAYKEDQDPFRLFQFGNIVKFWMDTKCVSAFLVKTREIGVVGSGEESDRVVTISGPTVHYLLNDFNVQHDKPGRSSEMRAFNWASVADEADKWEYGGWFDKTGTFLAGQPNTNRRSWNHPINSRSITNPPGWRKSRTEAPKLRPKYALYLSKKPKWPDSLARWIWISQVRKENTNTNYPWGGYNTKGKHYYRTKAFNITAGGARYRFSVHSDTYYQVWLDGQLFMTGNGNENYKKFQKKITVLSKSSPTNTHCVAVYVEDRKSKGKDYDHNDAFILTVQRLNSKGAVVSTVLRSNASSWYAWHGENPPTWSRAMILYTMIQEARARNNESAKALTVRSDFGKKSDDGYAWHDTKKFPTQIQVGTSCLDLQAQFSESLKFDVWVNPDTLTLHAWQGNTDGEYPRGRDRTYNVALVPGYNLVNYSITETDNIKNRVLVQYNGGFVTATNDDSITQYGRREGYIEFGGYRDGLAAKTLAEGILKSVGDVGSLAGSEDLVGHVNEEYSGSIIPVKGAVPFLDWEVGDTISAPASNGLLRPHRVLSISCSEDSEGNLGFDPELQGV